MSGRLRGTCNPVVILLVIGAIAVVVFGGILPGTVPNEGGEGTASPADANKYGLFLVSVADGSRWYTIDTAGQAVVFSETSNYNGWGVSCRFTMLSEYRNKFIITDLTMDLLRTDGGDVLYGSAPLTDVSTFTEQRFAGSTVSGALVNLPTGKHTYVVRVSGEFSGVPVSGRSISFYIDNQRKFGSTPVQPPAISDLDGTTVQSGQPVLLNFWYKTTDPTATYVVRQGGVDTTVSGFCIADGVAHTVQYTYKTDYAMENTVRLLVKYDSGRYSIADDVTIVTYGVPATSGSTTTTTVGTSSGTTNTNEGEYTPNLFLDNLPWIGAFAGIVIVLFVVLRSGGKKK